LGGWELAGIYTMESGAPLNILNGVDADGLGGSNDRPNYNPYGTPGTRAVVSTTSPTGYVNGDTNAPINPLTAMYIQVPACTSTTTACTTGGLGRNTVRTPILNNLDANVTKSFRIREGMELQFRAEMYNVANHRQYGNLSSSVFDGGTTSIGSNVGTTPAAQFLAPGYADGGARVMKYQLKFVF
jgi:hypothetical protein